MVLSQVIEAARIVGQAEAIYPHRVDWVEQDKDWLKSRVSMFWRTMEAHDGR